MTTRTVTGNTILLTGSAQASQTVTFIKLSATISGTTITQSGETTATTDADGNFSASLDCPADGGTSWVLMTPDGTRFPFDLPYGDGSSVAVTTLISADSVTSDAVTLLLDSYALKSGATFSGLVSFSGTSHAGLKLLSLTTTQRDALTAAVGMVIYNSTTGTIQGYASGAWITIASTTDLTAYLLLTGGTMSGTLAMADNLITRPVFKDYGESVNAIGATGGGTQDIDLTLGNVVSATVDTSANTFTFSNPSASGTACSFTLFLTNGGSQTVNWPASVDWAGGTAPTLTASGVDILTFTTLNGGTTWYGFAAGLDMQ